jgi:preprotein translocase subunit SecD
VRFRLAIVDPDHNSVLIPDTANPNPARDPKSAKQIRQDPALATDKAAQQRAAASLDCAHADPLAGMDDPKLPLATCGSTEFMELFGPVLLDRTMVVGASYGPGGPVPGRWDVSVELSAAGRDVAAELAPKNVNVLLGMFFDGQLAGATPVPEKSTGTLELSFDKEDDARQVATVINNR